MHKILITGNSGYVASSLYTHLKDVYEVTAVGRNDLDLSNAREVQSWFANKTFDVVIHTAIQGGHRLYADNSSVTDTNLKIYYNLLDNKDKYNKFINIGSGAELFSIDTPYGLSKHIIRKSVWGHPGFYNIRAYGIFDENERSTRFIKSNIINYINKVSMHLHDNKKMDFFYMKDFVKLVRYFIDNQELQKEIDCSYEYSLRLSDILNAINQLGDYTVPIQITPATQPEQHYTGYYTDLNLDYIGLHAGIKSVYEALLCNR